VKKFSFPPYPKNPHASGQARITIRGKVYYLGRHGTPDSHREYNLAGQHNSRHRHALGQ